MYWGYIGTTEKKMETSYIVIGYTLGLEEG